MMNKRPVNFVLSVLAILFFAAPAVSVAQDSPPPLSEMWMVVPKADHKTEFYESLARHKTFRSEQGDPRSWQVYTPLLGDELGRVAIRSCCFSWADQDTYREWGEKNEKVGAHFNEHVAPHVEKWEHYFETMNWKNSHWNEQDGTTKFYAVTQFNVKAGHGAEFKAARDKILQIALNQGWATDDHLWLWATRIGGKPQESIIIPHENFASMNRDEDSFSGFLSEHMGAEAAAELLQQFSASTWGSDFQIWEYQEKYSMSSDD
jgi:hypothetical protein